MVIDGKPYFARGFFDVTYDDLPLAAAAGANTVSAVGHTMSDACFNSPRANYQDRAYDLGLNMVPSSSSAAALGAPGIFPKIMSRFANHIGNISWFLADEPDQEMVSYNYIPAPSLLADYQAAKPGTSLPIMADFQHASWDTADAIRPYAGAVDIWMAEPYGPDFSRVNHAIETFNSVKRQPIWLAQDNPEPDLIVPKAYWTVIGGATGIIYFSWEYFKANPAKLAAATQAFAELHQLNDVIFAANVDSRVTPPAGIGAMARSLNGSVHIMAVNPKPDVVQGRFRVQGLEAGTQIAVLFENRIVTAEAEGFSDTFSGVSRHVYKLPGRP
ncbi:MAG TPA: hypothetical protein VGL72_10330 [Bryobacteraceae bacterium]